MTPNFPVLKVENKYYSIDDYLTTIGGQISVIMGFVVFFAGKFLYLATTKKLVDKLEEEKMMKEAEDMQP